MSIDEDRSRAYEWSNYRYAAAWINSSKQRLRSSEILDPCEIGDDWLELHLPSLLLQVTDACPPELRARAQFTLERLHLVHDERVVRYRREWLEAYEKGAPLELLEKHVPLLGRALGKRADRATKHASRGGTTSDTSKTSRRLRSSGRRP